MKHRALISGPFVCRGSSTLEHRDDLQGLRAVAVLVVVLAHSGVDQLGGGYVGVDVFFVLSGFLITGLLVAGAVNDGRVDLVRFYVRRARRILPAATLALLVTDVAAYVMLNFVRARQVISDSLWSSLFAENVHAARQGTDYFARFQPPSAVQQFWSLAVEEQFYVLWPAMLGVVVFGVAVTRDQRSRRASDRVVVSDGALTRLLLVVLGVGALSLAWSIVHTPSAPNEAYFATLTRAWELALGAALAIGAASVSRLPAICRAVAGWLGLAMIGMAVVGYSAGTAFPGYAALLPCVGAALVIAAGIGGGWRLGPGRLLGTLPMRFIGDRSYALYLWHWPVLIIAAERAGHVLSVSTNLLLVAAAFAASIVTYHVYERPIHRSHWSGPATFLFGLSSVVAVMTFVALALPRLDDRALAFAPTAAPRPFAPPTARSTRPSGLAPPTVASARLSSTSRVADPIPSPRVVVRPLPAVVAAVRAADRNAPLPSSLAPPPGRLLDDQYHYPDGCSAHDGDTSARLCRLGDPSARRTMVVLGDSHAQMWMPDILSLAERDGWAVTPIGKSACLPHSWLARSNWGSAECKAWFRWAVRAVRRQHPDVVIVAGDYGSDWPSMEGDALGAVRAVMRTVPGGASHVVIVGDVPPGDRDPVDCVLASGATMRTCTTVVRPPGWPPYDHMRRLARDEGAGFLETRGWFCVANRCPTVIGQTIAFLDQSHITQTYARQLTEVFRAAFRRTIRAA